ncbi:MAG: hypothetical protein AAFR01_01625 [Pseudomonadota bacterium]
MRRKILTGLLVVIASTTSTATVFAGDAKTTRIEPRPYYGATVTIEAGVRVFRPLPPTKHVIINPGSRTPINLSETNVIVRGGGAPTTVVGDSGGSVPFKTNRGVLPGFNGFSNFRGFGGFRGFRGRRVGRSGRGIFRGGRRAVRGPIRTRRVGRFGGGRAGRGGARSAGAF